MLSPHKIHVIPERFTFDEDTSLKVFLRNSVTESVEISGRNLRRIDSLLLQYLIAAAQSWRNAGLGFCLTDVPKEVGDALTLLGVDEPILCWKVAA